MQNPHIIAYGSMGEEIEVAEENYVFEGSASTEENKIFNLDYSRGFLEAYSLAEILIPENIAQLGYVVSSLREKGSDYQITGKDLLGLMREYKSSPSASPHPAESVSTPASIGVPVPAGPVS